MRIVIEPGSYRCQNMGDVAMLQVAVTRLSRTFPGADVRVLTNAAGALAAYCPGVRPVAAAGRAPFLDGAGNTRPPWVRGMIASARAALGGGDPSAVWSFLGALEGADLLLIAGQGSMGDATASHARIVLATLELAQRRGVPTAMVGQGIGPLRDAALLARAAEILPGVELIALREGLGGPPILASLGVVPDRIRVTGDDAVELALDLAPADLGEAIGVNLRIAGNAGVSRAVIEPLKRALHRLSASLRARPLPLPIARGQAKDADVLRELLGTGTEDLAGGAALDSPAKVIAQVGQCRVVVTGAYHAAVFALAQGVPVVFLAESEYYVWKYEGLVDQFRAGCELIPLGAPDLAERVYSAVSEAWHRAESTRGPLLRAAADQVARGQQAYDGLARLGRGTRASTAGVLS